MMADVRTLLRQQQAARRIAHPLAHYSDTGKLSCAACNEPISSEKLWDVHERDPQHQKRLRNPQDRQLAPGKRPHPHEGGDREEGDEAGDDQDLGQRKRSRTEPNTPSDEGEDDAPAAKPFTPMTPSQGVELKMPSRPATPRVVTTPSSAASSSRSASQVASQKLQRQSTLRRDTAVLDAQILAPQELSQKTTTDQNIDEDEWAAFEADITAESAPYAEDAVISAPAMTAKEVTTAAQGADEASKAAVDVALENEREDAALALEREFEDMEALEAQVWVLKEKWEALRQRAQSRSHSPGTTNLVPPAATATTLETTDSSRKAPSESDEDDENDDDDEEDDWDGFRFVTRSW